MAFPYHFPSNTPAQSSRRRQLLDAYGQFAQLSAIILPLFLFLLSFIVRFLYQKLQQRRGNGYAALRPLPSQHSRKKLRQSPRVATFSGREGANATKEERERERKGKNLSASIARLWTLFVWVLDEPVAPGWGTRREWSVAASWTAWLLVLVVKDTGDDYLHLTRRFGIVAASQLPLHYLLALKSWSPIQYLTRLSHEELNPYHRILGRILTFFFLAHGLLYLNFYVQLSILPKRIYSAEVLLGLSALTTLLVLNSTALARVRTWSYRLFFGSHVILSIVVLPLLYFHVSHARLYVLEAAAIYIILIVQRNFSSTPVLATITQLSGSPLLSIRIPLVPRLTRRNYHPGQHIYLSLPPTRTSPLNKLRHHPFTIATLPSPLAAAAEMQLVIRPIRGTTQLLSSFAQPPQTSPKSRLLIEGPYGASRCFPDFLRTHNRILLVAGGVGATFTLPIYRHLLQQQQQQRSNSRTNEAHGQQVRFVWSVRSIADATWGLQELQLQEPIDDRSNNSTYHPSEQQDPFHASHPTSASASTCDIYISTSTSASASPSPSLTHLSPSSSSQSRDLELQPRNPIAPPPPIDSSHRIHTGRPDLRAVVDEIFSEAEAEAEAEADINVDAADHVDAHTSFTAADNDSDNDNDSTNETVDSNRRTNPPAKPGNPNRSRSRIRVAVLVCGPVGMGAALRKEVGRWVRRGRGRGRGTWDVFWHNEEFGW